MTEQHMLFHRPALSNLPIYFYHEIDLDAASINVQVLGPGLTHAFHHHGEKDLSGRLVRKTTGFLAVTDADATRVILTWAESGHGASPAGELLSPSPFTLPNRVWSRRAAKLGKLLHINANSVFDGASRLKDRETLDGVFFGSHVEVKLSTFAVLGLLQVFGILSNGDAVGLDDLLLLRRAMWQDGSRPRFAIHFSRAPCPRCRQFVRRLERITGIDIALRWHQRLVPIEYESEKGEGSGLNRNGDDTVSVFGDTQTGDNAVEDPTSTTVDLTKEPRGRRIAETADPSDVEKPLPATPEKCAPEWLLHLL